CCFDIERSSLLNWDFVAFRPALPVRLRLFVSSAGESRIPSRLPLCVRRVLTRSQDCNARQGCATPTLPLSAEVGSRRQIALPTTMHFPDPGTHRRIRHPVPWLERNAEWPRATDRPAVPSPPGRIRHQHWRDRFSVPPGTPSWLPQHRLVRA